MMTQCIQRFHKRVGECLAYASREYGSIFDIPRQAEILCNFEYMNDPLLAHASHIPSAKHAKVIISLNAKYAEDYWAGYEEFVVPHELAHIICFKNDVHEEHGDIWGELCMSMGGINSETLDIVS